MLRQTCLSLSCLAALASLSGCNPETFTFTPAEPKTVGFVNTIQGAKVWHDLNDNYIADTGEPQASTDAEGRYVLPQLDSAQLAAHPLLAWVPAGAKNVDTNGTVAKGYFLRALPGDASIINPITTVAGEVHRLYPAHTTNERTIFARAIVGVLRDYPLNTNYSKDTVATTQAQSAHLKKLADRLVVRWGADFEAATSVVQGAPKLAALGVWGANFYWMPHFMWAAQYETDATKLLYRPLINPAVLAANRNFFALPRTDVSNFQLYSEGVGQAIVDSSFMQAAFRKLAGPDANGLYSLFRPGYQVWNPSTRTFGTPNPIALCYTSAQSAGILPGSEGFHGGESAWVTPIARTSVDANNCLHSASFDSANHLRVSYYSNTGWQSSSRRLHALVLNGLAISASGDSNFGINDPRAFPFRASVSSPYPNGRDGVYDAQALALEQSFNNIGENYSAGGTRVYFTSGTYGNPPEQIRVTDDRRYVGITSLQQLLSSYPASGSTYYTVESTQTCSNSQGPVACPAEVTLLNGTVRYKFGAGTNSGDLIVQIRNLSGVWQDARTGRWSISSVGGRNVMIFDRPPDSSYEPTVNWESDLGLIQNLGSYSLAAAVELNGSVVAGSYNPPDVPTGQVAFWLYNNAAIGNMTNLY
ncbi:hypothetical protein [Chitinimonas sp. BJYL2]|uniref:hypothetical protein n=1 Tax=Chitinimonas sp. BJYL2 TaxID=2976696 RepID=UPI0022B5B602|nr:hypothetical protein [Chitinimonas sp. BJYL2]